MPLISTGKKSHERICDVGRRIMSRMNPLWVTSVMIAILTFNGCSTTKPPTDTLAKAELGVRAAREAGANELAPVDMKRATEKLERAKQAMAAERYDDARRLAESAQVEAELAEAKAEAEIVRRAADDLQRRVDALQTEAERDSRKPLTTRSEKE